MLILDSNVWIHAVTVGGESQHLLEEIIYGSQQSVVNAYISEEVRCNIDNNREIDRDLRDRALEQFFSTVSQCPDIRDPELEAVEQMDLDAEQEQTYNELIGALGDIQAKDAPILTLAYRFLAYQPTIYTNDEEFAQLSPADYGVPEISISHCELEWTRPEQPAE